MRFSLILAFLLSIFTAVFALMNTDPVTVNFGVFEATGPTALVVLVAFGVGLLVGMLVMLPGRLRQRRELRRLTRSGSGPGSETPSTPETTYTPPYTP
ncbi:MAG: hypothetical protein KatS3mg042_1269 [Rhodothermaceae bacterium]|nr:MAG: hypothetical protein KatS3mg042_1269 [Rhodothermaceae bacterium]